jgi:hypothetical protein
VLRALHQDARWRLVGELYGSSDSRPLLASLREVRDATHGPSIGQGIGIYNRSEEASRVYAMSVLGR